MTQHAMSCQTLLDMVGIGMGATIVFQSAAVPHEHVVFRPIAEPNARVSVVAKYPRNDANPLRHRLLRAIKQAAQLGSG